MRVAAVPGGIEFRLNNSELAGQHASTYCTSRTSTVEQPATLLHTHTLPSNCQLGSANTKRVVAKEETFPLIVHH